LGFGTKGGTEAIAAATGRFLEQEMKSGDVLVKLDFSNAFNTIFRDKLSNEVKDRLPELYPFLYQCYRDDSTLLYNETEILSSSGVQQGDPLGPALFSLILQPIILPLCFKLNCWYLDDGTLGGLSKNVLTDLQMIIKDTAKIGLQLNPSKCEIFIQNSPDQKTILADFDKIAPGIKKLEAINMTLFGAPLTDAALKPALECKIDTLRRLSDKLEGLLSHHAFHLLRH